MIPDSLFSPPISPCFVLLKVLVSSCSKSLFHPVQSPVPVLFRVPFSSLLKATFPSSSFLSVLFLPLEVLSPPPRFPFPSSPLFLRAKENSGTTRSRPAVHVVVRSKMEHCSALLFGRLLVAT